MKQSLRTALRQALRGRVFRRTLPAKYGGSSFYVAPESQLKYLRPGIAGFDLLLLEWAAEFVQLRSKVWDIGANVGVFTFAAAGFARKGAVLALEPDPFLAHTLVRSCSLPTNSSFNVEVLAAAISSELGVATLEIARGGRASNALSQFAGDRSQFKGREATVNVPTLTLDWLLDRFGRPDLVKIDVEGAECAVLAGAEALLSAARPKIIIETDENSKNEVTSILQRHNYALYDAESGAPRTEVPCATFNTLAIPR
ncbi:FkbM family methyltransferase [Bradyrhizobium vignae]|uniref:FkbM family methyltransferase n=1 Tax=Bradyrhizobium vignae TaxID=1549949 RepID=UPI00100B4886|nr:FkbM family methyltransferase [Bradyrhizobium vignae]RXG85989.1 FkbM family methyltransferase [Bradyrhizobium vignae]